MARRAFIRTTGRPYPAIDQACARAQAAGWATHEIEAGHDIMIDAPGPLADILCDLAA